MPVVAITYPLTLPTSPAPKTTRFELRYLVGIAQSPFTGAQQAHDWGGRVWSFTAAYPVMSRAKADPIISFAAKLHGVAGWFAAGDWDRRTSRGNPAGTPLVNGGGQVGNGVTVDGFDPGATLKEGDHIQIGIYLHMVAADFTASAASGGGGSIAMVVTRGYGSFGSIAGVVTRGYGGAGGAGGGEGTIQIEPALRTSPADNAPIIVANAMGLFRMIENSLPWDSDAAGAHAITFSAIEKL